MLKALTRGPFTGRHFSVIIVAFFGVVIAVNLVMARAASSTFGGVVVENSYVASQQFNGWLDQARKQKALRWSAAISRTDDGRLVVKPAGLPAGPATVSGSAHHPLGRMADQPLTFARMADGSFVSTAPLPAGRWQVRLRIAAQGQVWRDVQDLP